jgi:copper chaperone CopZ
MDTKGTGAADRTPDAGTVVTEIGVEGADCAWCMNETLDQLRSVDGVTEVHASVHGCISVAHVDADVADLLAVVRSSLHGTALSSNEMEMAAIEPVVRELRCPHSPAPGSGETG